MAETRFEADLAAAAERFETLMRRYLESDNALQAGSPARLLEAMRHGTLGGGKRLRPYLVTKSAELFGADPVDAMGVAVALECVHCYSLIHDDLPAMDDDDLRRGKPTVHRAFDDATAILAGDALLTLAFGLVAADEALPAAARCEIAVRLAHDAGAGGMVGGQVEDLAAEAGELDADAIAVMQAKKTGALIAFACEAGAIVAQASQDDRARLRRFGEVIGLAFQLADDLLDETAAADDLGKAAGKDRARGKKTLPALNGHDWTRRRLEELVVEAGTELAPYGARAADLMDAARFIAARDH